MRKIIPWNVVESRRVINHPFIRVIEDVLEHPDDGRSYKYYYLASHSHAVATVALTNEGNVVLTRQYRHPVGRIIYDLPAGRTDRGEEAIEAARRELREETGYEAGEMVHLGFYNQFPGAVQAGTNLFLARDLTPGPQNLDDNEDIEVIEIPFRAIVKRITEGEFIDGSLQLGVLLVLAKGLGPKSDQRAG
ncbi:MAG: NUDIX hydrolase [Anaerolineae bacterium]